jgi:integrase
MPRLLKGLRQRGRSFFFRLRLGGVDQSIPLGQDLDRALTRALEIRRRIEAGLPPTDERHAIFTVRDAVHRWLEDQVSHTRQAAFAAVTRSRCERVLLPFMGRLRLDEVTTGTLYTYRNHLSGRMSRRGRPMSAATIRMHLGDVRAMLNHALTLQVLDRSPIPRRWLPKLPERAPDVLSRDEQAKLVNLPGEHGRVLRLLLGTGLRWGELVRAQAQDIQGGKLVIRRSKSGRVRRVPLPADILAECVGRVGRLSPFRDVVSFNRRVRELSGIERFHSHLCRHTFATEWRQSGGSLAALQAVLEHATIAVTERYGTIGDDLVEREAQRLDQYRASDNAARTAEFDEKRDQKRDKQRERCS